MLLFKKHTFLSTQFFQGFTDFHCHILPGVDDGVKTMQQALAVLGEEEKLGVSDVWCTPHIMEDIPNTTADLRVRFDELCDEYKGSIRLHLAAEYMLDGLFRQRLEQGDLLTLGTDNQILVETSYFNAPLRFHETLNEIKAKGYFPVLAHPERYMYMDRKEDYDRLLEMGIRLQLNLGSLAGAYGKTAQHKAEKLLARQAYTFSGTDIHHLELLQIILAAKAPNGVAELKNK